MTTNLLVDLPLTVTTGMRRGELLGLRWSDVDLTAGRVAVLQTLVMVRGQPRYSEPKTRRSRRNIELDRASTLALGRWREQQQAERRQWGVGWQDHGLVFTREDGNPSTLTAGRDLHPSGGGGRAAAHLVPRPEAHAGLADVGSGVHPEVASERLGHHWTAFALDVYTHVVPGMQQQAAETVAGLIIPAEGGSGGPSLDSDDDSRGLER